MYVCLSFLKGIIGKSDNHVGSIPALFLLMIACIKSCIAENSAAVEKRLVTLIISRFPTGTSKAKKGKLPSGPTYTVGKNYKSCFFEKN